MPREYEVEREPEEYDLPPVQRGGTYEPPPNTYTPGSAPPDRYQRITTVDKAAVGTLPTETVLYLAGLGKDDRDLVQLSRVFARNYQVPPEYIFGTTDPKKFISPITGQPISVQEARILTNNFAPAALAAMLAETTYRADADVISERDMRAGKVRGEGTKQLSTDRIAAFARTISDYGGTDVGLAEGVALSTKLARDGMSHKNFAQNMDWIKRWWLSSGEAYDVHTATSLAISFTERGITARSMTDVIESLVGEGFRDTKRAVREAATTPVNLTGVRGYVPPAEELDEMRLESELAQAREKAIRTGGVVPILGKLSPSELPDYWAEVEAEAERIRLSDEAFENSWFNRAVIKPAGYALHLGNLAYKNFWAGAVLIMRVPIAGVTSGLAGVGLDPQGDTAGENWEYVMAAGRFQAQRLYDQRETPGSLIAEGFAQDNHWVASGLDFAIAWYLDPFAIAGASRANYLKSFLAPGVLEKGNILSRGGSKIKYLDNLITKANETRSAAQSAQFIQRWGQFASSKSSRKLFEETSSSNFLRRIYQYRGKLEARQVLDPYYMQALRDRIRLKYPDLGPEAWEEWQTGIKALGTGHAPAGSVAADVINARITGGFRAREDARKLETIYAPESGRSMVLDEGGLYVPEKAHQAMMNDVLGNFPETNLPLGWSSLEAPGVTALSRLGPRRLVRQAITSTKFTDTAFGKRTAQIPNMNPGRQLEFHNAPEVYAYEHATRWGVFDESELRHIQADVIHARNSGRAVEDTIEGIITKTNKDAFQRVMATTAPGVKQGDELFTRLYKDLVERPTSKANKQLKQAFGGDETQPLFESQLRNQLLVVDPVEVRAGIRSYISMRDRVWQSLNRHLRKEAPELQKTWATFGMSKTVGAKNFGRDMYEGWLRFWRGLTVARPAYFLRVVMGDENARFLATTSSVSDRILALGVRHRGTDAHLTKWLDDLGSTEVRVGENVVKIRRSGAYEYEPRAAGQVRQSEVLAELVRGSRSHLTTVKADGGWELLKATDDPARHADAWAWDLSMQMNNSAPGRAALESVARGESVQETVAMLKLWARDDRYVTLITRIGRERGEVDDWAEELAKVVHSYTMGNKEIAGLALHADRTTLRKELERLIPEPANRPLVHAPTVGELTDGGVLARGVDKMYDIFVRRGEDAWNRQSFFSEWKRRAEISMYEGLNYQGVTLSRKVDILPTPGRKVGPTADIALDPAKLVPGPVKGDAEGYLYHLSPTKNFDSIRTGKLNPTETTYGISPSMIPPHMRGPRLFFSDSVKRARELAWQDGDNVALRIKAADVGDVTPEQSFSHSWFGRNSIDPERIEFRGADGAWHNMVESGEMVIDPTITRMIDRSSTEFALGQVKRVMFDFTKQSRFTEMLQVVFPFPQPFFEGFQAWGHILWRNPRAIVHMKQLFELGVESEFFKKDPLSGEYMVPLGAWRAPLIALGTMLGGDSRLLKQLDSPWVPLMNLNMLTSSTVEFGEGGIVGKAIGGVPIPVPSMNPLAAGLMMKAMGKSRSPVVQGYLYQYGPNTSYLPTQVKAVAQLIAPGLFEDESSRKSLALTITEAMHRTGMDRDENGNVIPLNDQERDRMIAAGITPGGDGRTLEEIAYHEAERLMVSKAFVNLFAPTSLRIAFRGQREDYAAWQTILDSHGDDYRAALDEWFEKYPDKPFIPAGRTLAGDGYEQGQAVRLPASEITYQMYRMPGVGEFMRDNPEWAALMLIGTDPRVQNEQNFMAFSDLLAKNLVRYKTPTEYVQSAADARGWRTVTDWQRAHYYTKFDKLVQQYGSESAAYNSPAYLELKEKRQEFFDGLYATDPHWVLEHLVYDDVTGHWDWPGGYGESHRSTQEARADAERIIDIPELQDFPGVIALREYMDGTQRIAEDMNDARVPDINSDRAKEQGFFSRYEKLVARVSEQQPDLVPFLTNYFGVRIEDDGTLRSTDDLVYNLTEREWAFSEVPEDLRDNVIDLDRNLSQLKNAARENPMSSYERSLAYSKINNLINVTWNQDPKVIRQWWQTQGTSYQQDYRTSLATKPIEFYTAWDFELAGLKLSPYARKGFAAMEKARVEIARLEDLDPVRYSESEGYAAINAFAREYMAKEKGNTKSFATAVAASNQWGWGIDNILGYGKDPERSKADQQWRWLLDAVRDAQTQIDANGWQGVNYGSDSDRNNYIDVQRQVRDIVEEYRENPTFDEMWKQLQEDNGEPIIGSLILPDDYFPPLGSK